MLNMIKMDLYRITRSKSIGAIFICLALWTALSFFFYTDELEYVAEDAQESAAYVEHVASQDEEEDYEFGMTSSLPAEVLSGESKLTLLHCFYGEFSSRLMLLFFTVFCVFFAGGEISSGYRKNISCYLPHRGMMYLSKLAVSAVFTAVFFLVYCVFAVIGSSLAFGYFHMGDLMELLRLMGVQYITHLAFCSMILLVTYFTQSNGVSILAGVLLAMNLFTSLLFPLINKGLTAIAGSEVSILKYSLIGNISMVGSGVDIHGQQALIIAAVYLLACTVGSMYLLKKRDL